MHAADGSRAEAPLRILVPSIVDPATFRGGAGTATRGLISLLRSPPLRAHINLLRGPLPRSRPVHAMRRGTSAIRSWGSALPAKALFQRTRTFRDAIERALALDEHDLLLINGTDLAWILELAPPRLPGIVWAHNLEHELFARQLETLRGARPVRRFLSSDLAKLRSYEIQALASADGALFISSTEAERMRPYLRRRSPLCVPPVFTRTPAVHRRRMLGPDETIELGLLANAEWWPNRDAIRWLLTDILPRCRGRIRVNLFGQGTKHYGNRSTAGTSAAAADVVAHGYVADLDDVWRRCDVMICPIRTGAGVNVKLAEALYHGLPLLATPFAADGLPVKRGPALAIVDGADAWIEFLDSPRLRELAGAEVPRAQREMFDALQYRAIVQDYFLRVAGR